MIQQENGDGVNIFLLTVNEVDENDEEEPDDTSDICAEYHDINRKRRMGGFDI